MDIVRLAEHGMVPADDLGKRVAHRRKEVFVGGDDLARRREFDDRLGPRQGVDLALIVGALCLRRGDVRRELHHLVGLAAAKHRIIGGLDPDLPPALTDAPVLLAVIFAAGKACPKVGIGSGRRLLRLHEHAVMPADNLVEIVTHRAAEIPVGGQDRAGKIEFDDRLRPVDRIEHGFGIGRKKKRQASHEGGTYS
jgi:hypothetical protein